MEEQTRRHSLIASLLGIPHIVVAINKMDLVDYNEEAYWKVVEEYKKLSSKLEIKDVTFVPVSALKGDNVVDKSENMPWYKGTTLMYLLENIHISSDENHIDCRFPVQYVIRPQQTEYHDYRGYAGKIFSGVYKKGDKVKVLPAGHETTIAKLEVGGVEVQEAFAPQPVVIQLTEDIDISRGDTIAKIDNLPEVGNELNVLLCWLDDKPLQPGNKYYLQH